MTDKELKRRKAICDVAGIDDIGDLSNGSHTFMELKDTVQMMTSADWKERFKAEYFQLKIRSRGLKRMLNNWDSLSFTPNCPKGLLIDQYNAMDKYLAILKDRAAIEGIEAEE